MHEREIDMDADNMLTRSWGTFIKFASQAERNDCVTYSNN